MKISQSFLFCFGFMLLAGCQHRGGLGRMKSSPAMNPDVVIFEASRDCLQWGQIGFINCADRSMELVSTLQFADPILKHTQWSYDLPYSGKCDVMNPPVVGSVIISSSHANFNSTFPKPTLQMYHAIFLAQAPIANMTLAVRLPPDAVVGESCRIVVKPSELAIVPNFEFLNHYVATTMSEFKEISDASLRINESAELPAQWSALRRTINLFREQYATIWAQCRNIVQDVTSLNATADADRNDIWRQKLTAKIGTTEIPGDFGPAICGSQFAVPMQPSSHESCEVPVADQTLVPSGPVFANLGGTLAEIQGEMLRRFSLLVDSQNALSVAVQCGDNSSGLCHAYCLQKIAETAPLMERWRQASRAKVGILKADLEMMREFLNRGDSQLQSSMNEMIAKLL